MSSSIVALCALLVAVVKGSTATAVVGTPAAYVNSAPYNVPPFTSSVNVVNRGVAAPYIGSPYYAAPDAAAPYFAAPYAAAPYFTAPYAAAPYVTAPYAAPSTPVVAPLKYTASNTVVAAVK